MDTITVSIRDLHARTGHFVRKASATPVIVTDNGKPVAELRPLGGDRAAVPLGRRPKWKDRVLVPGYAAILKESVAGDSSEYISEDRDRGADW